MVPIQQLGSISVADGNTLMVNVFDAGAVASVEKAIMASDLGLNPQADGSIVRLRVPDLTEDRRNELVKYIKNYLRMQGRSEILAGMKLMPQRIRIYLMMKKSENQMLFRKCSMSTRRPVDDLVKVKEDEIRTI